MSAPTLFPDDLTLLLTACSTWADGEVLDNQTLSVRDPVTAPCDCPCGCGFRPGCG